LYSGQEKGLDGIVPVKFFPPDSSWTWYASEFDDEDTCFGLVKGLELELGYLSLKEMKEVRDQLDLPIERDMYLESKSLKVFMEMHRRERRG